MKIDCIISSSTIDSKYFECIPFFIKMWEKILPDVDIKIILISKIMPQYLIDNNLDKYIILFNNTFKLQNNNINEEINIPTVFLSQYIRLLYPCILNNYENGILVSDIDMIPLNNKYFTKNILNFTNDKFIYYRGNFINNTNINTKICICYNIATYKIWSNIFNINSLNDIYLHLNYIIKIYKIHWFIDQELLYINIINWNNNQNFICLDDKNTGFNRFVSKNSILSDKEIQDIKKGIYTDYHYKIQDNNNYNKLCQILELF